MIDLRAQVVGDSPVFAETWVDWDLLTEDERDIHRDEATAALDAALDVLGENAEAGRQRFESRGKLIAPSSVSAWWRRCGRGRAATNVDVAWRP